MEVKVSGYFFFSLFYIVCQGNANLTFKNFTTNLADSDKSWTNAQKECHLSGGYLATLEDLVVLQKNSSILENEDIWVGHYGKKSSWMDIVGCFQEKENTTVDGKIIRVINNRSAAVCELLCASYPLFALKGNTCACLNDSSLSRYNLTEVDSSQCNRTCNNLTGLCGGKHHFTVFKRVVGKIGKGSCTSSNCNCVPSNCQKSGSNKLTIGHFKDVCSAANIVLCRNGLNNTFESWTKGLNFCRQSKTWPYPVNESTDICETIPTASFWTSGFRHHVKLHTKWTVLAQINIDSIEECMYAAFYGENYTTGWLANNQCNSKKNYYCSLPSVSSNPTPPSTSEMIHTDVSTSASSGSSNTAPKQTTTEIKTDNNLPTAFINQSSQDTSSAYETDQPNVAGPVIGAVLAIIVLVGVVIGVICFKRRKKPNPEKLTAKYSDEKANTGEREVIVERKENLNVNPPHPPKAKLDYDLAMPVLNNTPENTQRPLFELAKGRKDELNKNQTHPPNANNGYDLAMPVLNNTTGKTQTPAYELANVVHNDESDYAYTEAEEGEYDLLNEKDKRKLMGNSNDNNTYAHTGFNQDKDDTYDSMHDTKFQNEELNNYDTTKITKSELNHYDTTLSIENPYDHSNS